MQKPPANRTLALALFGAALMTASLPAVAQPAPPDSARGPGGMQTRIFQQADADHDGRVTEVEAKAFLATRFADADANKDGGVTSEELSTYLRAQMQGSRPAPTAGREPARMRGPMNDRMAMVFRVVDADRDGRISLDELQGFGAALFRAADANADGALERNEVRGPGRPPGPAGRPAPRPTPDAVPTPGGPEAPAPRG